MERLLDFLYLPMRETVPWPFPTVVALIFGCCLGSFLNVCVWRIPRGESIVFVPSHCPQCGHPIRWFDNVPILGYLALRGRCRDCHAHIPARYFWFEAGVGLLYTLWVVNAYFAGSSGAAAVQAVIALTVAVPCFFIDRDYRRLPDQLTGFGMAAGVLFQWAFPDGNHAVLHAQGLLWGLAGLLIGLVGLGMFAAITGRLFRRPTMGGGDIKYAGFVGGCFGWPGLLAVLCLGSLAAVLSAPLLKKSRAGAEQGMVPFGMYLGVAVVVWGLLAAHLKKYGI